MLNRDVSLRSASIVLLSLPLISLFPAKPTSYTSAERKLWTMYNEEAGRFDMVMMNNWKGDMDSILIFVSG
jgi:hypothetical protein